MNQGDVYWFKFKEPNKERPVVILTRSDLIPLLNSVTVAEITTNIRDNDAEVWLGESDGMPKDSVVNLINIQTIPKSKLGSYITQLSSERMDDVGSAIEFVFRLWSK